MAKSKQSLSKNVRRARNGLIVGLAVLILWLLDLGGPSPRDGQREKDRAPTENESSKSDEGDRQAKKGDVEQVKSIDKSTGNDAVGPVRKPPEDVLGGLEATFERFLLDKDYELSRAWVDRQLSSKSESIRRLAERCRVRLRNIGDETEAYLRSRIQVIPLLQAEEETARFAEDWPQRMEGFLAELPAEVRVAPTSDEIEVWSRKINEALPVEMTGRGRLLRLSKGKAVLRVPGQAGGFRHDRVDLTKLQAARLLALCPDSEEPSARRFLSSLYLAAGLPVSASWLFFGEVRVQPRAPDPGR